MSIFEIFKKSDGNKRMADEDTCHGIEDRKFGVRNELGYSNPTIATAYFKEILIKYQRKIYWHIRKMVIDHDDANDLTQDTFIKVWTNLSNYRGDSQIYTWIYRIATNECLNFLEKKKRNFSINISEYSDTLQNFENNPLITGESIQIKLQSAILQLPDKQRLIFNLKYFDHMQYSEIATITGTSEGALKASYHHAVKKIEEFLKKD